MSLRARKGIAVVDWGDDIAIPMTPIYGMWSFVAGQDVPLGGSPDMLNCTVRSGMLCKRPGYVQFPPGASVLGARIVGLYSTQDVDNASYILAATTVGLYVMLPGAGVWTAVAGPALTGSTERVFQFETSQNSVIFSQGVDTVMRYVFAGAYAALSAGAKPARYLTRFADRVFLAYTIETATNYPFRVRRCVAQDHTDWAGVGSGFHDLTEFPYHIRNIRKMNTQAALYTERSIYLGTRTELIDAPVRWDTQVTDIGLYAPYTLKGRNTDHRFLGNDDFYSFDGSQVRSIGFQIRESVYPILNINKLHMCFAEMTFDTQEYLVFICTGSDATPSKVWVNNWQREIWYPWSVDGPVCSTVHRLDNGVTIDSIAEMIDKQAYEIDSQASQAAYPSLITGHADGKVYRWTTSSLSDNGSPIQCRWTSKDFVPKDIGAKFDEKIVLKAVFVRYKETGASCTLDFSYSVDGGSTWTDTDQVVLNPGTNAIRAVATHRQVTGNQIRLKIENFTDDEAFQLIEIIPVFEKPDSKMSAT